MRFVFFGLLIVLAAGSAFAADRESAYDRVMRTGTIRCGYMVGEPYFMKDPKTGRLSGIWHDYVEEMGHWLGLKIDWAAETGLGDIATALDTNRIDVFCVGLWINPGRARVMDFTMPITYQIVNAYARYSDKRFDNNLRAINDPSIKVSCLDGEMAATIAQEDFPKAQTLCLPQLAPYSDMMMSVAQRKTDVTFASPAAVAQFNKSNPPGLRNVETPYPIRIFPESLPIAYDSENLRRMIDHTTAFLINSGKVEQIIKTYSQSPDDFLRTVKPYEVKQ